MHCSRLFAEPYLLFSILVPSGYFNILHAIPTGGFTGGVRLSPYLGFFHCRWVNNVLNPELFKSYFQNLNDLLSSDTKKKKGNINLTLFFSFRLRCHTGDCPMSTENTAVINFISQKIGFNKQTRISIFINTLIIFY